MEFLKMRRGEERVVEVIFKTILSLQKMITFITAEVMRVGELFLKISSNNPHLGDEGLRGWAEGRHIHSWVVKVVLLSLPSNCFTSCGAGQRAFLLAQLLHLYLLGIP